jgi:hypothetical protein
MHRTSILSIANLSGVLVLSGCVAGMNPEPAFRHDISGDAKPWTHEQFDDGDDKFTFAVFSDINGGEREGVFEIAAAQLGLLRPEFAINVGDLINGESTVLADIHAEWESFDARARLAGSPVFKVGGNHDLEYPLPKKVWDVRHGPRYYHFRYKDVLFLVLDTEDYSPQQEVEALRLLAEADAAWEAGGPEAYEETAYYKRPDVVAGHVTPEQAEYFRGVIAANEDVRWTFLFLHKTPWLREGERNFASIEASLADRPYTVFHGHFHTYQYSQRNGLDYIRLATTGGSQDMSERSAFDHVTLVTVDDDGVDVANLLLSGILDKTGHIPLGGDENCFQKLICRKEKQ